MKHTLLPDYSECSFYRHLVNIGLYQKKSKQGELRTSSFVKTLAIFSFVTLPLEILKKTKLHPKKSRQIV